MDQPTVIVESPYAGDRQTNETYAKACLLDALERGEAPYLSHLLYTQVLEDTIPDHREMGLNAAMAWIRKSDWSAVYTDLGVSGGMMRGILEQIKSGGGVFYRELPALRQTGRTHRMLEDAVKWALDAIPASEVFVFVASQSEVKKIYGDLLYKLRTVRDDCTFGGEYGVRLGNSTRIRVLTPSEDLLRGLSVDRIFVDHHAWQAEPKVLFETVKRHEAGQ